MENKENIPKPERQKVIGFPNELANDQPCSFTQSEFFLWKYDPQCRGLYCQKCPEHWLVRLLSKIDRDADRREAKARELTFDDILNLPVPRSSSLIERDLKRNKKHRPINWIENEPDDRSQVISAVMWWKDLPSVTISERCGDHIIANEIETHQWD